MMKAKLFAVIAAAALPAAPVTAAPLVVRGSLPVSSASHYGPVVNIGWGGGWGWGGGYRHRHRDRTTAGDVLAGVLIIGTIAAVVNAANRANERRAYPYRERYPYPDRRSDYRDRAPQGLEGAADLCLREVERDARAREVTRIERTARGWDVTGTMADGAPFTCSIGADGRIDDVSIGGRAQAYDGPDNQYRDERYLAARAAADAGRLSAQAGGSVPGDPSSD